jgi:hypothetical protein
MERREFPFILPALALGLTLFAPWLRRSDSAPVSGSKAKALFLVRFGVDGKEDVDWSGRIDGEQLRLRGWQFNTNDSVNEAAWKCSTQRQRYWDTPYEAKMQPTSNRAKVTEKGVIVEYQGSPGKEIRVLTSQGDFSFPTNLLPGEAPRFFLDGRASVSAVPASTVLTAGPDVEDYPSITEAKDGTLWLAYQAWTNAGDQILVRNLKGGVWSEPQELTDRGGDDFRTAIAQDGAGRIWVVWSARKGSNFDLYGRSYNDGKWSPPEQLTKAENSDIFHTMVSDVKGNLYLAYQSARSGTFDIYLRIWDGKRWGPEIQASSDPANDWEPALAASRDGRVTVVWDTYARGNYDVVGRTWQDGKLGPVFPIAQTGAAETRASAQYDSLGRLWVAWDEGDWNWGKDYGYQIPESGRGLLVRRRTRVAVMENGRLLEAASPISEAVPEDQRQVFQHPALVIDGNGNPWVFFRTRVNLPVQPGQRMFRSMWRLEGTVYRDGRWNPMMEFTEGCGRIDSPMAVARRSEGGIGVVWVSDGRLWPDGFPKQQDLMFTSLPVAPAQRAPRLLPIRLATEDQPPAHPEEARDIQRVRSYRVKLGDQTWRILRGDIHRHTDLSWDGNRDGSLDDSYRYALDAAGFDYLGVCDHQAGESIPYNWWRIQKAVDLYTIQGRFAPLYSYERSLNWPNGHRNVFFPMRGRPVLEVSHDELHGEEGAAKLYAYLGELGGLTSAHTSASNMGTDWRDNDPAVEPVVEIYQGYRSNFETLGAPRAPTQQESSRFDVGFVWRAWEKGYKLGVQASSDHVSTHISYAGFYVDRVDRDSIIAAMKARRSYASTDNIFVDLRMGGHFMGESFVTSERLPLSAYVSGSGPLDRVDLIKSNRIVYVARGTGSSQIHFTYSDQDTPPGQAYYYIRVQQKNGQLCWSSPIWVEYR